MKCKILTKKLFDYNPVKFNEHAEKKNVTKTA